MTSDPLESAHEAAALGRSSDAVMLLESAGANGNVAALAELAVWHLRGDIIPRNLSKARSILRRAVTIGHVDAALMEIALAANGSGDVPDWQQALNLLRAAATTDPVAAEHLRLLDKMDLDRAGYPAVRPAGERLSDQPFVERFPAALSAEECLHVATLTHDWLEPAVVVDPRTGRNVAHPIRSSDGTLIGPTQETLVVAALNRRFAALTGTRVEQGEPLSVLRYKPGQEYRLHLDTLPNGNNQRAVTAIAYLNDGFEGGETYFPSNHLKIKPRAGDVLVFRNVLPDGAADPNSKHAGLPVLRGVKWIATRWIRQGPYDPWTYREGS